MNWINKLIDFLKDLVCKCFIMCNCKSGCIKEQTEKE